MTKFITAAVLSLSIAAGAVQAQTLHPQMSAQDVRAQIDPDPSHLIVPILMMLFLVLTISGGEEVVHTVSDERLKTDIRPVGRADNGLTIYEFRYRGQPGLYRGVMAQEVQDMYPDATYQHENGYLYVNYDALGMRMERVR